MKDYIEAFGAKKSPYDIRDYKGVAGVTEYPEEFELQMGEIKNQGYVSSCVPHSLSEIIEYFNKKQENSDVKMSVGYIYGNRDLTTYKDKGMYVRDALKVAEKYGDVPDSLFPYNLEVPKMTTMFNERNKDIDNEAYLNRITSYYHLDTKDDIKYNLMYNGPVIFSIDWYEKNNVIDGKLIFTSKEPVGAHCMVIYGWSKDGWKIMNSWGKNFGNNGCAILPYENTLNEAWGVIDTNVNKKSIDIIKPDPIPGLLVWLINFLARLLKR